MHPLPRLINVWEGFAPTIGGSRGSALAVQPRLCGRERAERAESDRTLAGGKARLFKNGHPLRRRRQRISCSWRRRGCRGWQSKSCRVGSLQPVLHVQSAAAGGCSRTLAHLASQLYSCTASCLIAHKQAVASGHESGLARGSAAIVEAAGAAPAPSTAPATSSASAARTMLLRWRGL